MPDFGAVGFASGEVLSIAYLAGAPRWYNPLNRARVVKDQDSKGPQLGVAGFLNGRVPVDFVTQIASDFGQTGGGVTIFE